MQSEELQDVEKRKAIERNRGVYQRDKDQRIKAASNSSAQSTAASDSLVSQPGLHWAEKTVWASIAAGLFFFFVLFVPSDCRHANTQRTNTIAMLEDRIREKMLAAEQRLETARQHDGRLHDVAQAVEHIQAAAADAMQLAETKSRPPRRILNACEAAVYGAGPRALVLEYGGSQSYIESFFSSDWQVPSQAVTKYALELTTQMVPLRELARRAYALNQKLGQAGDPPDGVVMRTLSATSFRDMWLCIAIALADIEIAKSWVQAKYATGITEERRKEAQDDLIKRGLWEEVGTAKWFESAAEGI